MLYFGIHMVGSNFSLPFILNCKCPSVQKNNMCIVCVDEGKTWLCILHCCGYTSHQNLHCPHLEHSYKIVDCTVGRPIERNSYIARTAVVLMFWHACNNACIVPCKRAMWWIQDNLVADVTNLAQFDGVDNWKNLIADGNHINMRCLKQALKWPWLVWQFRNIFRVQEAFMHDLEMSAV